MKVSGKGSLARTGQKEGLKWHILTTVPCRPGWTPCTAEYPAEKDVWLLLRLLRRRGGGLAEREVFSLREVGLDLLPAGLRRPAPGDSIQEIVIPLDEYAAPWLPKAVQATADRLKADPSRRRR